MHWCLFLQKVLCTGVGQIYHYLICACWDTYRDMERKTKSFDVKIYCSLKEQKASHIYYGECKLVKTIEVMHCSKFKMYHFFFLMDLVQLLKFQLERGVAGRETQVTCWTKNYL